MSRYLQKMKIYAYNRSFKVEAKEASSFAKYTGLMFKSKETDNLLFYFGNYRTFGIHSCFVFFDCAGLRGFNHPFAWINPNQASAMPVLLA